MSDTEDRPVYAPLTRDEFNAGCAGVYEGVGVCEDENGDYFYSWGHVDPALMLRAIDGYAQEMWAYSQGEVFAVVLPEDVQHRYAQTIKPADDPDGWWISFAWEITKDSPHAWPITIIEQGA